MTVSSRTRSWMQRFRADRRGVTVIEFAILAIPFYLVIFALLELASLFTAELVLEKAANKVGRMLRVGEVRSSSMTQAKFAELVCDNVGLVLDCSKLAFDLKTYSTFAEIPTTFSVVDNSIDTSGFGYDSGNGGMIIAFRIFYKWPIVTNLMRPYLATTQDGSAILVGASVSRTEPF